MTFDVLVGVSVFAVVEGVNALGPFGHHFFEGGFGDGGSERRGGGFFVRRNCRSLAPLGMTVL